MALEASGGGDLMGSSSLLHRSSTLSFMNRSARVLKLIKSKIIHITQIMEIQHNHKARIMESRQRIFTQ